MSDLKYIQLFESFVDSVNEDKKFYAHVSSIVKEIMRMIKSTDHKGSDYVNIGTIERLEDPFTYDMDIILSRNKKPDFKKDSHFHTMEWEEINFKKSGVSVDGNVYMDRDEDVIPEVEITILMDPSREPKCYERLFFKLTDVVAHELHHLTQIGWNRRARTPLDIDAEETKAAKHSYKYFLLPHEVESMVKGMYTSSMAQNLPIDEVFEEYLNTFLEHGYISKEEMDKVIAVWLKYTMVNYPRAIISKKYNNLIHSI